jgi:hypothetical protein
MSPTKKIKPTIRPSHRKAVGTFLDQVEGPFRRSHLVDVLFPLTNPRSRAAAESLSDSSLKELMAAGLIQRHGHLHYTTVQAVRKLIDGSLVPELSKVHEIPLSTKCPGKWLAVDCESGAIWVGSTSGWKRASAAERKMAVLAGQRKGG